MPSTIDFASYNNDDLIYGYQRVNKSKFPENFHACIEEITRRGLDLPTRFDLHDLSDDTTSFVSKISDGLSNLAGTFTKRFPTTQA